MKLSKIKEMLSKISEWPWVCDDGVRGDEMGNSHQAYQPDILDKNSLSVLGGINDLDFMAASPTIIDQLIKQNEVMREALVKIEQRSHHGFEAVPFEIQSLAKETLKEVERIEDEKGCN